MIVVEIKLVSAISEDRDEELGTLIIDNITSREKLTAKDGRKCDYRCRMYRKGALAKAGGSAPRMVAAAKHTRETIVRDHARIAEPVQTLVADALFQMGYGHATAGNGILFVASEMATIKAMCARALAGDQDKASLVATLEGIATRIANASNIGAVIE